MTRRRLTIALHWTQFLLLVLLISDGVRYSWLVWAFVMSALAFGLTGLIRGLMTRPGPKLTGIMRHLHPWQHRAMYVLSLGTAIVVAMHEIGTPLGWPDRSLALMLLLSVTSLHAIYHLWRHTALGDGALRIITPRALHKIL